jgi:CDP-glycerol glycerophosphotransferase
MILKNFLFALLGKIIPLKKNTWVFSSFNGDYSDSPRAISETLHNLNPAIRIRWVAKQSAVLPNYVERLLPNTLKAECAKRSASVLIDNVYADMGFHIASSGSFFEKKIKLLLWLRKKKGQKVYTTWHGTPLKRMARDQIGNNIEDFLCNPLTMFVNTEHEEKIMRHITFDKVDIKRIGRPRNDALFNVQCAKNIKEKIGIPYEKKIILFAPTFRNDGKGVEAQNVQRSGLDQMNALDVDEMFRVLTKKFGGEWVFVCRFHYFVSSKIDWKQLNEKYPGKIVNGNTLSDMADYLACADILITDASSCMFDFAVTKKPCFIFFPDLDNYRDRERGFYLPINSLPFPVSTTKEEFIDCIANFDQISYEKKLDAMIGAFKYVDDGKSAKRIVEYIERD